jgi:hypothetical protein
MQDDHNMKSAISSLQNGLNLISDEWKKNPKLVEQILPLMLDKIKELELELKSFHQKK